MSDPKDGPKRTSTEPTLVIDIERALSEKAKAEIAKAAAAYPAVPITELDEPDDVALPQATPEELADMLRARRREQPTLVACPICKECAGCDGQHMVTAERAAELRLEAAQREEKHR